MSSPDVLMFKCRFCGTQLSVPISQAGVSGPCPNCGQQITSPTLEEAEEMVSQQLQKIVLAKSKSVQSDERVANAQVESEAVVRSPKHVAEHPVHGELMTKRGNAEAQGRDRDPDHHHEIRADDSSQVVEPMQHKTVLPSKRGRISNSVSADVTSEKNFGDAVLGHDESLSGAKKSGDQEREHEFRSDIKRASDEKRQDSQNAISSNGGAIPEPGAARQWGGIAYEDRRLERAARPWDEVAAEPDMHDVRKGRRGVLILAFFLLLMALLGVGAVFENQLRMLWHSYRLHFNKGDKGSEKYYESEVESELLLPELNSKNHSFPPAAREDPGPSPSSKKPQSSLLPDAEMLSTPPQPQVQSDTGAMRMEASPTPSTQWQRDSSSAPLPMPEASMVVEVVKEEETVIKEKPMPELFRKPPEKISEAVAALKLFLYAEDWTLRSKYVQHEEEIRSLMEQYYRSGKDGPIHVDEVQAISGLEPVLTDEGKRHVVFQLVGGDVGTMLPVMVEESDIGWKVDWLTFIEGKDRLLEKFYSSYIDTPARFRVLARRKRYFEKDVPDVDSKLCFELQSPAPGFLGYAFVDMGTPLARELDRFLGWDVLSATLILELQWRKSADKQWVEVVGIPSMNWRMPTQKNQTSQ